MDYTPIAHGRDCKKSKHIGYGYLHYENDDSTILY